MQIVSSSLLEQITSLSSYPISAYSTKIKVDITFPPDEGRTKQSFKDESDINHIMARYLKTGVLEFAQKHAAQYADVTGLDFEVGMQVMVKAKEMFADLPAKLRARFGNDPGAFLDFVQDDANYAEAQKLGLLKPAAPRAEGSSNPPSAPQAQNRTEGAVETPEASPASEPPRRARRNTKDQFDT